MIKNGIDFLMIDVKSNQKVARTQYLICVIQHISFIMMNKTCKNDKPLLVTDLIFYKSPKANGKILLGSCWGNQSDKKWVKKYVIAAALYSYVWYVNVVLNRFFLVNWMKVWNWMFKFNTSKPKKSFVNTVELSMRTDLAAHSSQNNIEEQPCSQ